MMSRGTAVLRRLRRSPVPIGVAALAVSAVLAAWCPTAGAQGPPSPPQHGGPGVAPASPGSPPPPAAGPPAPPVPAGGRAGAAEVTIVGGNVASARERALAEALKQAVDQAIGAMVPDPHAAQPKTVIQVLGRSRSYVRRYRTLEEGEHGRAMYRVRVEAEIDEGALLRAFDKPLPGVTVSAGAAGGGGPTYLLVGAGVPDAVDGAAQAFAAAGARVQVAPGEGTEPAKALEAAARAGIATVAFVSGSATAEGKVRGPGSESVSCTFSVRILTSGTGLPLADETETTRAFGDRPESARAACFQRAAATAVPRVVPAAIAQVTPDMRTIVLDAEVSQPAAVPALVKQVRALGSVSAIEVRRISPNGVELWVRSRLAAAALAAALGRDTGAAVLVSGAQVTGDLVRAQVRMRETAPPADPPAAPPAPTSAGTPAGP